MNYLSRLILIRGLICLTLLVGIYDRSMAQNCDHEALIDDCKKHLDLDNFIFIKDFDITTHHGKELVYSFNLVDIADYEYWFTGDDWSHHTMTAKLMDGNNKVVESNHHSKDEYTHVIRFKPEKSGIYYIHFQFHEDEDFCGSAVLGFHRADD